MKRKNIFLIIPFVFLLTSCYIEIKENVMNPEFYLEKIKKEVERAERARFWRSGKVSSLNIFVYDRESKDIVKVSVPIWLFNFCIDIADEVGFGKGKKFVKNSKWECEIDYHSLKNLSKLGPGVIMEVKDENSSILIWMR